MSTADASLPEPVSLAGSPPRLLVVRAPYYAEIVASLSAGAERLLAASGATFETADVAGAFELAPAIRIVLRGTKRYDGFVALGCVVRGETDHYEHICRAAVGGLARLELEFGIALGMGLLTVERLEQAHARAQRNGANKGAEAARAALLQIGLARRFGASSDA